MQTGNRHLNVPSVNDQITQSQSLGMLPIQRTTSRLDPMNENNKGSMLKLQEI